MIKSFKLISAKEFEEIETLLISALKQTSGLIKYLNRKMTGDNYQMSTRIPEHQRTSALIVKLPLYQVNSDSSTEINSIPIFHCTVDTSCYYSKVYKHVMKDLIACF